MATEAAAEMCWKRSLAAAVRLEMTGRFVFWRSRVTSSRSFLAADRNCWPTARLRTSFPEQHQQRWPPISLASA